MLPERMSRRPWFGSWQPCQAGLAASLSTAGGAPRPSAAREPKAELVTGQARTQCTREPEG